MSTVLSCDPKLASAYGKHNATAKLLRLRSGDTVGIDVEGNRLVVKQFSKPCYTLDELLAQCDAEAERSADERDWLNAEPVGDELL